MRIITCNKCGNKEKEIEFEYLFFQKKYNNICKNCQEKEKEQEKEKRS